MTKCHHTQQQLQSYTKDNHLPTITPVQTMQIHCMQTTKRKEIKRLSQNARKPATESQSEGHRLNMPQNTGKPATESQPVTNANPLHANNRTTIRRPPTQHTTECW